MAMALCIVMHNYIDLCTFVQSYIYISLLFCSGEVQHFVNTITSFNKHSYVATLQLYITQHRRGLAVNCQFLP